MEFISTTDHINISSRLHGKIDFPLFNGEAQNLNIESIWVGEVSVENFVFNECTFTNCKFSPQNLKATTFLNCRFFDNLVLEESAGGLIHVLGGYGNGNCIDLLVKSNTPDTEAEPPNRQEIAMKYVLEKFWPVGRDTISHKHRPIKGIVSNCGELKPAEVYKAIDILKKQKILLEPMQPTFVEINFDELTVIKSILDRSDTSGK